MGGVRFYLLEEAGRRRRLPSPPGLENLPGCLSAVEAHDGRRDTVPDRGIITIGAENNCFALSGSAIFISHSASSASQLHTWECGDLGTSVHRCWTRSLAFLLMGRIFRSGVYLIPPPTSKPSNVSLTSATDFRCLIFISALGCGAGGHLARPPRLITSTVRSPDNRPDHHSGRR